MKYHLELDIELRKNTYGGKYIVLEGIDGSGKTTQVKLLTDYFKRAGKDVINTREPWNDGLVGAIVRKILQGKEKVPPIALQYLFSADRAIMHEKVIVPALKKGTIVISDRCFWSAVPYGILDKEDGGYDFESGKAIMVAHGILSLYHQFLAPDITFYLDINVATAMKRINRGYKEREIYEEKEKIEKIEAGYKWLISQFPQEIIKIDGERPVGEVTENILKNCK